MKFGAHILLGGDLTTLPQRAKRVEGEVFQMFSRSPRGGAAKPISKETAAAFRANCAQLGFERWYVHAPYVMNLTSRDKAKSVYFVKLLTEELGRAEALGARAVVTHLGSALDGDRAAGLKGVMTALQKIKAAYRGPVELLLEISAGAGHVVGDNADDFAAIQKGTGIDWGICLDTAHLFGSGYDLRTTASTRAVLAEWEAKLGLRHVKLLHFNDSAVPLASRKDRHAHIGKGEIGLEGFRTLIQEPRLKHLDAIIETPKDEEYLSDQRNLRLLKTLRAGG